MTARTIERRLPPRLVDDDDQAVGWCTCRSPRWLLIPLFDCHECGRCGRPNLGELLAFRTRQLIEDGDV